MTLALPEALRAAILAQLSGRHDRFATPGDLARHIDPRTVQTPALDLIDRAIIDCLNTPDGRLILTMSPQEGKSSRAAIATPIWALHRNPNLRVAVASYAQGLANRNGRAIRNQILAHPELGMRIAPDNGAASEWTLAGHEGGVLSVGRGAGITGRPVDCVSGDTHIECEYGVVTAEEAYRIDIQWIRAYDHETGRAAWHRVEASRRIERRPVVEVVAESGRVLTCTPDHRVHSGRGYVAARDLLPGDALTGIVVTEDAVRLVREVRGEGVSVYDFQVEGARNFFANGLLVHNCLIIDDPIKDRQEADSKVIRQTCWDWWTDSLSTRLSPGASVILMMTRWHAADLAGLLQKAEDGHLWRVLNIPAQCEKPDTDPLGRKAGEFMASARGRTQRQWEAIKVRVGSRTWAALYQGHPSPAEGGLIKRDWWQRYGYPQWEDRADGTRWASGFDEVIISADLTFKGTDTSDYVAIGVWGRRGHDAYLLDQDRRILDFVSSVHAFTAMSRRWPQAILKLVEDKANGPALISMLAKRVPGIVPVNPTGSKITRVNAWAPLCEAGHLWIPTDELAPWVGDYVEEAAAFPNGAHDDQVDHTSQAIDRLLIRPMLTETITDDDPDDTWRIGY